MRLAIVIVLLLLSVPRAVAQDRIELGPEAAVQRTYVPCAYSPAALCAWWQPQGRLTFGDVLALERATTFAHTANGRIVAMVPSMMPTYGAIAAGGALLYTDDLGATWRYAEWPDPLLTSVSIAFDPEGPDGVAVGAEGSVWSSADEGLTWRRRRSSTGAGFRRVWVRSRTCVIEDVGGALWISRDGGFRLESLAPEGRIDEREGELVVIAPTRTIRIDAHGTMRRQ